MDVSRGFSLITRSDLKVTPLLFFSLCSLGLVDDYFVEFLDLININCFNFWGF